MKTVEEINKGLAQQYGTLAYYTNKLLTYVYTTGVKFMWESCDAYWLLIAISSYQHKPKIKQAKFQVWELKVNQEADDNPAVLTMKEDSDQPYLVEQKIPYTDFPLDEITLYLIDDGTNIVLLLPSEY